MVEYPSPTTHRQIAPNVPPTQKKKINPSSLQAAKTHPTRAPRAQTMLPKRHQLAPTPQTQPAETRTQVRSTSNASLMWLEHTRNASVLQIECIFCAHPTRPCPETPTCTLAHVQNVWFLRPGVVSTVVVETSRRTAQQPQPNHPSKLASQPACGLMHEQVRFLGPLGCETEHFFFDGSSKTLVFLQHVQRNNNMWTLSRPWTNCDGRLAP